MTTAHRDNDLRSRGSLADSTISRDTNEIFALAKASDEKKIKSIAKMDDVIQQKILKDKSPEAKLGRRKMGESSSFQS